MKKTQLLLFALMGLTLGLSVITVITTITTIPIPPVYAGGGDDDGYSENKQKVEDESAAAVADCDWNNIEEADFDCTASAAAEEGAIRDIGPPTPPPEPEPEPETATLRVCKEIIGVNSPGFEPSDFTFTVAGNNPSPAQFPGDNEDGCVDVTIGPGEYTIEEELPPTIAGSIRPQGATGDCIADGRTRATGEIESGQTETCTFTNLIL